MERNYQTAISFSLDPDELDWRTAFHEAGHAAAIHIGNQQKQLPPVFFEIQVKKPKSVNDHFFAKVIDGNLIQNLPIAMVESFSMLSGNAEHSCQRAYEADVVNLLVGPLSEAKYVAQRDGEVFNLKLISLHCLQNYGGLTDMERIHTYLDCFIASRELREKKIRELLAQAYSFIDNHRNWRCILNLAYHILESKQETISCDEAINVLDMHLHFSPPTLLQRFSAHVAVIS
jgi:hypothetical protein